MTSDKSPRTGWEIDDQWNIDYYTKQTKRYGIDSKSLDWGSRETQVLRFKVLAEVLPSLDGMSILDVGCGLGDFCGWLKEKPIKASYRGLDIVPEMLAIAQSRFPLVKFDLINLLAPRDAAPLDADVVVASGIFAKRFHDPFDFLSSMVEAMFNIAKNAVAFNSLSTWAADKEDGEFYADPDEVLRCCRTLTPWVVLRHDYHSRDFTIYMYKNRNR